MRLMRVLVTGAEGFIGRRLITALLREPALTKDGDHAERITEIVLTSRTGALANELDDPRISVAVGDIGDAAFLQRLFEKRIDSVFHLAAVLTADAEEDFERGLQINILGMIELLDLCRAQGSRPRVVFASSMAAFGGPLPERVDDRVTHTPQTSYGTAKAIGELLINDYSRHGFVDGRALRLPIVVIRPVAAPRSVADQVGAVLREPLLGRNVVCPLSARTCVPLTSVRNAVQSLIRLHEIPSDRFGHTRAMNMPALTVPVSELVDAVQTFDYPGRRGRICWAVAEDFQAIVDGWPSAIVAEEALRFGLRPDASVSDILRSFVEDYGPFDG